MFSHHLSRLMLVGVGALLWGGCASRTGCDDTVSVRSLPPRVVDRMDQDRLQTAQGFVLYPEKAPRLVYENGGLIDTGGRVWTYHSGAGLPTHPASRDADVPRTAAVAPTPTALPPATAEHAPTLLAVPEASPLAPADKPVEAPAQPPAQSEIPQVQP